MSIYNFGVGTIIGRRTGVDQNNVAITIPTPARFGTVQDVDVEFDRTLKELIGQYQFPVDIAAAATKITGKAKLANIQGAFANELFFGQTMTTGASVGEQLAVDEVHAAAATVTIAPPGSGTYVHDLGVFYQATGIELVRVASAPAVGSYSVVETTGVYTFNASEAGNLLISYSYTVGAGTTTMKLITLSNQLMGISPSFELHLQMNYPNNAGVVCSLNLKLNACRSSKFGFPFKNQDYTMPALDFMAFADASNNLGTITFTQ